jgi:aminoglycoside phosphotransferase (APT) family kinase protein
MRELLGVGWTVRIRRRLNHPLAVDPVFGIEAVSPHGVGQRFVLKLFPGAEAGLAEAEVASVAVAQRAGLPVPEVVAADDGGALGIECVLMTRLPGRPVIRPREGWPWLVRHLAELLVTIHRVDVSSVSLGSYVPHGVAINYPPPSGVWSSIEWGECLRVFRSPPPEGPVGFLHRDFHAGNVLWTSTRRLGGIVDWADACIGSPWADVAHLRFNLWRSHGEEAAQAIVAEYQRLRPDLPPYHPYWDIATAMSIPWLNREPVLRSAVHGLP